MLVNTNQFFQCETCSHFRNRSRCDTHCDSGESYTPDIHKLDPCDSKGPKSGHWIPQRMNNIKVCSVCGKVVTKIFTPNDYVFDYKSCPYCMSMMTTG